MLSQGQQLALLARPWLYSSLAQYHFWPVTVDALSLLNRLVYRQRRFLSLLRLLDLKYLWLAYEHHQESSLTLYWHYRVFFCLVHPRQYRQQFVSVALLLLPLMGAIYISCKTKQKQSLQLIDQLSSH